MNCHDCNQEQSGEVKVYKTTNGEFVKCMECFEKDSLLRNYQPCEVWSRVVGYLRPISTWNPGKTAEFRDRKEYSINKDIPVASCKSRCVE